MNNQAARILFAVTLLSLSPALVVAQSNKTDKAFVKQPLAHTYSIVARDPETGQLGVAAQSHWFSVGAIVPWAEAGIGAVATQSFVEPAYGPLGLALMRAGRSAPEALKSLLAGDSQASVRQVAMIDAQGRVASHTGEHCIAAAGHRAGANYAGAVREYGAAEALVPDNIEMVFWHAVTLANANKVEEALPLFKRVFAADGAWATLVPRLPKSKLLPDDQKIIQRILSAAPAGKR